MRTHTLNIRSRRHITLTCCVLPAVCLLLAGCTEEPGWTAVDALIRSRFPGVEHITADTLAARLQHGARPLLLDVRTAEEFAVSHLAGAVRMEPEGDLSDLPPGTGPDTPIVVYCSVGYRSAAMAERLRGAGYLNVTNLRGAIFQWANEGRPLYRDGKPVREVHPYDRTWGRLLRRELHAYAPESPPPRIDHSQRLAPGLP